MRWIPRIEEKRHFLNSVTKFRSNTHAKSKFPNYTSSSGERLVMSDESVRHQSAIEDLTIHNGFHITWRKSLVNVFPFWCILITKKTNLFVIKQVVKPVFPSSRTHCRSKQQSIFVSGLFVSLWKLVGCVISKLIPYSLSSCIWFLVL